MGKDDLTNHFSKNDLDRYGRLDVASRDLGEAVEYGAFVLKKGWAAKPWSRGTTYLQQSAFITAMVVSYGRAFSNSEGWGYIGPEYKALYDTPQLELHRRVMNDRNKLYAHSDAINYPITPTASEAYSDIIYFPVFEMAHSDIVLLQEMCRKVSRACRKEQATIKAKYVSSPERD